MPALLRPHSSWIRALCGVLPARTVRPENGDDACPPLRAGRRRWGHTCPKPSFVIDIRGGEMEKAMSFSLMAFRILPVMAPLIGQGILLVAGWRAIFFTDRPTVTAPRRNVRSPSRQQLVPCSRGRWPAECSCGRVVYGSEIIAPVRRPHDLHAVSD